MRADLPTVLITGDTSSAVKELRHDDNVRMASKPINADELLALLRELLGSRSKAKPVAPA